MNRMRYLARIRVSFRKCVFIHRETIVWLVQTDSDPPMRCDAIGYDAFVKQHDLHGLSTSNDSTSRSPSRQCNGNRVMDGTRWKISMMSRARQNNGFPIGKPRAKVDSAFVLLKEIY